MIHAGWALAVCSALWFLPGLYVTVRRSLHRSGALRCDWLRTLR